MPSDFFHPDMEVFIDHRVDWERYFRFLRGDPANVADELETFKMILRTIGAVCSDVDRDAGDHWHE